MSDEDTEESWVEFYENNRPVPPHSSRTYQPGTKIFPFCIKLKSLEVLSQNPVCIKLIFRVQNNGENHCDKDAFEHSFKSPSQ